MLFVGALDLFDTDGESIAHAVQLLYTYYDINFCTYNVEHGQPKDVVKSLLPVWNNFVFFDVNAVSFHQVEMYCVYIVGIFQGLDKINVMNLAVL